MTPNWQRRSAREKKRSEANAYLFSRLDFTRSSSAEGMDAVATFFSSSRTMPNTFASFCGGSSAETRKIPGSLRTSNSASTAVTRFWRSFSAL